MQIDRWQQALAPLFPGLIASATVAAAAGFLAQHYGAPVMLFALLLGMAMNFLSDQGRCQPGVDFAAKQLLRLGVALLGLRITYAQISALGWEPVWIVLISVAATILFGLILARWMGYRNSFGVLTGGSVAICGASAAMAISSALPAHAKKEQATLFTVIGVSVLSTLAMVLYPMLIKFVGYNDHAAGLFLGATIHDVAQVVGAGYGVSNSAGDAATVIKLMRVAMLMPVIVIIAFFSRGASTDAGPKPPILPWFVLVFALLVALGSFGVFPALVHRWGSDVSRWALVIAIAAIGIKTRPAEIIAVGMRPIVLMVAETAFLAGLVMVLLHYFA